MFLNGSLENFSVADILQLLSFSKQTGALHVSGEVNGALYLDDGEAYFATREGSWSLEDTVAAAGISREDWNAALESAGQSHAAGHALTELGVAVDLIRYVVHHIVSDTTFELMRMPRLGGSFDFRVGEKHAVGPVHKLRVDELVAEVRDRLAEWDAISEFISSPSDFVSAPSELVEDSVELTVSREQWALLVATIRNDRATVSELARETGRSDAEVAGALHPLISSGLVEIEAADAVVQEALVAEPGVPEVTYSPPPLASVFEADPDPLGDSEAWFPPVPEEAPEETAVWSDPETADSLEISPSLFESEPAETGDESDFLIEAPGDEAPVWDLEDAGEDVEEKPRAEEQHDEPPLSPADTIDVAPPDVENAGFRTLALQELRDLAGTAPVQPAKGPRPTNSKKPAETSDDKPPAPPKVRALKRIIAAVRGL